MTLAGAYFYVDMPIGAADCTGGDCNLLRKPECTTTFNVVVTESESIFTVQNSSQPPAILGAELHWRFSIAPYTDDLTWRGSFAAGASWPEGFEYRDLVAPTDELNVGDQFVVKRQLEGDPAQPHGGYLLEFIHVPQGEGRSTVGTYPTCGHNY